LSQQCKLGAQLIEHGLKARARSPVRPLDLARLAKCFDDQVDGAVMQVEATSIWQESNLRARIHFFFPAPVSSGHGFSVCAVTLRRRSPAATIELSGLT